MWAFILGILGKREKKDLEVELIQKAKSSRIENNVEQGIKNQTNFSLKKEKKESSLENINEIDFLKSEVTECDNFGLSFKLSNAFVDKFKIDGEQKKNQKKTPKKNIKDNINIIKLFNSNRDKQKDTDFKKNIEKRIKNDVISKSIINFLIPALSLSYLNFSPLDFLVERLSQSEEIKNLKYKKKLKDELEEDKIRIDRSKGLEESLNKQDALLKKSYNEIINFLKKPDNTVVITKYNIGITVFDFKRLIKNLWLNDTIIDYYMSLISDQDKETIVFSVYFYKSLKQNGYKGVRSWGKKKKVNVCRAKYIFIPININNCHWALVVVDKTKEMVIYYDSAQNILDRNQDNPVNRVIDYLKEEYKSLNETMPYFKGYPFYDCPQQNNSYDCGVYACLFARFTLLELKPDFLKIDFVVIRRKIAEEIFCGVLYSNINNFLNL